MVMMRISILKSMPWFRVSFKAQCLKAYSTNIKDIWKSFPSRTPASQALLSKNSWAGFLQPVIDASSKKSMKDSYMRLELPFASDVALREQYVNFFDSVRVGKVMEDMDALAATIAYKHCSSMKVEEPLQSEAAAEQTKLTIVTASVDRIELLTRPPLSIHQSLRISGFVCYVGSSSMEVALQIESQSTEEPTHWTLIAEACFTLVARHPVTHEAYPVPKLELHTSVEQAVFEAAQQRRESRRKAAEQSLDRVPPLPEESSLIHNLFIKSAARPLDPSEPSRIWMSDTRLYTTRLCHPQEKNIHHFIFGGFLMREAFELAFATASTFCRRRPDFLALDETSFKKPVPIGSLLCLTSQVVWTGGSVCVVSVQAEVLHPVTHVRTTTNTFHFSFQGGSAIRPIWPKTYEEAMLLIQGKRRREQGGKGPTKWTQWINEIIRQV